jgi:diguanylate cyclase (GGDEF)-like protein
MATTPSATRSAKPVAAPNDRGDPRPAGEGDRLGLYRLLASFPALATLRAKVAAIVAAGFFVPTFVLVLAIVLGAGRLGLMGVIAIAVVLAAVGAIAVIVALDRLLVPLELAESVIDDVAFGRPIARTDLPGTDVAAQVLRGVQALAQRVEREASGARERGERDELTGLLNRGTGRDRAQAMIDRETRRGLQVRVLLADVVDFAAFNARHGNGNGDAMLKAIAGRLARVAGDDGVAMRWSGDAFVLVQAGREDDMPEAEGLLARPIVVKGSEEPLRLALGSTTSAVRVPFDTLVAQAEAALRETR